MKVLTLATVLLVLTPVIAFAQFNDSTNYFINYSSTGIYNKTNDRSSFLLNNGVRFNIYKKKVSLNTAAGWIYGKQNTLLSNNDITASMDFNLFKGAKSLYYWGLGTFEQSYSLKINHRFQVGGGIGYSIIEREKAVLLISNGILYEQSDLYNNEAGNNNYDTYRNSFRIKFRFLIGNVVTIEGSDFLQHSLEDVSDYIIRSNTSLSLKLYKWLSFTGNVTYNKLNRTGRENFISNVGLSFERYF